MLRNGPGVGPEQGWEEEGFGVPLLAPPRAQGWEGSGFDGKDPVQPLTSCRPQIFNSTCVVGNRMLQERKRVFLSVLWPSQKADLSSWAQGGGGYVSLEELDCPVSGEL